MVHLAENDEVVPVDLVRRYLGAIAADREGLSGEVEGGKSAGGVETMLGGLGFPVCWATSRSDLNAVVVTYSVCHCALMTVPDHVRYGIPSSISMTLLAL